MPATRHVHLPHRPPEPTATLLAIAALLLLSVAAGGPATVTAQPATPATAVEPGPDPALARAVDYLLTQQADDGGFAGPGGESDPGLTTGAIVALRAAAQRGVATTAAIDQAATFLDAAGTDYARRGPGQAANVVLALVAAGRDPRDFAGTDFIAAMAAPADDADSTPTAAAGLYGESVYSHALVLLALAAVSEPAPAAAIAALRTTQGEDGSWSYAGATEPGAGDSNTTALVLQALVATGHGADPMIESALAYLQSMQNEFGQVLFQAGQAEMADANSTALTVQALIATGQDPTSAEWANAARGLAVFQNVGGGFRYVDAAPADNLLATVQAIPALASYALPVTTACPEPAPPAAIDATPAIVALPAPGRGQAPCVPLAPAA